MLNLNDQKTIGSLLAKMNHYSLHRPRMYQSILRALTDICEMKGPSSVLRTASFNQSVPSQLIGKPEHLYFNTLEYGIFMVLWSKYIRRDKNPILEAWLKRQAKSNKLVDFVTGQELLESIQYYKSDKPRNKLFDKLMERSNIGELGYIAFMPQMGVAWVVCLRRRKVEGAFTERHRLLLKHFCHAAQGSIDSWYIPEFDALDASNTAFKNKLTDKQYETLYHLGNHCSRKECAKLMNVSVATVDRNVENLLAIFRENFDTFAGKNISQIIYALKNNNLQS